MVIGTANKEGPGMWSRLTRAAVGLVLLSGLVAFFASGYSPPGACGEVLRHNQAHGIDASALFYTEVENMTELEQGLAILRQGRLGRKDEPGPPAATVDER